MRKAMSALGFAGSSMSLKKWFWLVFVLHVNIIAFLVLVWEYIQTGGGQLKHMCERKWSRCMAPHMCDTVIILYLHTESLSQSSPMHITFWLLPVTHAIFIQFYTQSHAQSNVLSDQNTPPYNLAELSMYWEMHHSFRWNHMFYFILIIINTSLPWYLEGKEIYKAIWYLN